MISRCHGKHIRPTIYQRNGIKVCAEWQGEDGYKNFSQWAIENGYSVNLVIDRENTYGDYCPENCRFITRKENNRNKVNTVFVDFRGDRITLTELCERISGSDVPSRTDLYRKIYARVKSGKPFDELLTNC